MRAEAAAAAGPERPRARARQRRRGSCRRSCAGAGARGCRAAHAGAGARGGPADAETEALAARGGCMRGVGRRRLPAARDIICQLLLPPAVRYSV